MTRARTRGPAPTTLPCWPGNIPDVQAMDGKIFLTTGNGLTVYIYDTVANNWRTAATPPACVGGPFASPLNGKLYFWHGLNFYTYDPTNDAWAFLGQKPGTVLMPIDNGDVSRAVTMGGKIYVAGDFHEGYDVDLRHRHRNVDRGPPMSQNRAVAFCCHTMAKYTTRADRRPIASPRMSSRSTIRRPTHGQRLRRCP